MPLAAPVKTEPTGERPTYDAIVTIGRLVKADMTVQIASGKLFADDALAESVDEFTSASIAMETDDMVDDVASVLYGAEVDDGEVQYRAGDFQPLCGLTYYKTLMREGVKYYKGYYYPRVKAVLGNDSAATKGDTVTFGTNQTTFTVFRCNTDEWRITAEYDDETDVVGWCREMLGDTMP